VPGGAGAGSLVAGVEEGVGPQGAAAAGSAAWASDTAGPPLHQQEGFNRSGDHGEGNNRKKNDEQSHFCRSMHACSAHMLFTVG
jgi:hypothetical protein